MNQLYTLCERTVRASLKVVINYVKDYTKGNRTEEELDLLLEKAICILTSNISYMVLNEVKLETDTSYDVFSDLEIKKILHKNEGFLKFVYKIRNIATIHNKLAKEGKLRLSTRDFVALAIIHLYSINYINEAKILAKLLFELEVIGGVHIEPSKVIRRPDIKHNKQLV